MSVSVLAKHTTTGIGEGPHWDEKSQSLLYVDITARELHRFDTITGQNRKLKVDEDVGFVIPRQKGGYVIGQHKKICLFDWKNQKVTSHLCDVDPECKSRFNDAKCDAVGRLWTGTMGTETQGGLGFELQQGAFYSMDVDHKLTRHFDKVDISNGIAWTKDNTVMFYCDTVARKVEAFDYDLQKGAITNRRTAVNFGAPDTIPHIGFPDGMCIDETDKIWVACVNGGKVTRFDPETGKTLRTVEFPVTRITSCCFGGKNYDELFVTSGVIDATKDELKKYPLTGSVFKVSGLGVKGLAPNEFGG